MSEVPVCDNYVQHKWRKDTCANCQNTKAKHTAGGKPEKSKATLTSTSKKPTATKSPDTSPVKSKLNPETAPVKSKLNLDTSPVKSKPSSDTSPVKSKPSSDTSPVKSKLSPETSSPLKNKLSSKGNVSTSKTKESDKTKESKDQKPVGLRTKKQPTVKDVTKPSAKPKPVVASKPGRLSQVTKDSPTVPSGPSKKTKPVSGKEDLGASKGEVKAAKGKEVSKSVPGEHAKVKTKPKPAKPSEVYDTPPPTSEEEIVNSVSSSKSKAIPSAKQEQHYYHKYDVTAKGNSGSPQPLGSQPEDKKDPGQSFTSTCRVVDIATKPVAVPYTVVDVSSMPPNIDPASLDSPPKLPDSVPERDCSSTKDLSSKGSSAPPVLVPRKSGSPSLSESPSPKNKPKEKCNSDSPSSVRNVHVSGTWSTPSPSRSRKSKNAVESDNITEEDKSHSLPRLPVILYDEAAQMQLDARSPTPPRKVPILIPYNGRGGETYEPIEGADIKNETEGKLSESCAPLTYEESGPPEVPKRTTSRQQSEDERFVRQSPGRGSAGKSAAFEAKMAALAQNLDLQKTKSSKSETVDEQAEDQNKTDCESVQLPCPTITTPVTPPSKKKFSAVADTTKPDKGKKGKGFFSKLFRRKGSSNSSKVSIEVIHMDSQDSENQVFDGRSTPEPESQSSDAGDQKSLDSDIGYKGSEDEETTSLSSRNSPTCKKAIRTDSFKDTALTNELNEKLQSKLRKSSLGEAKMSPLSIIVPSIEDNGGKTSPSAPGTTTSNLSKSSKEETVSHARIPPKPVSPGIKVKPDFPDSKPKLISPGSKSKSPSKCDEQCVTPDGKTTSVVQELPLRKDSQSSVASGDTEVTEKLQNVPQIKQIKPISPKPKISAPKPLSPKPDLSKHLPTISDDHKEPLSEENNLLVAIPSIEDTGKESSAPPLKERKKVARRISGGREKARKPGQAPPAPPPGPPPTPPGKPPAPLPQIPPPPPSHPPPYSPPATSPDNSLPGSPSSTAPSLPASPPPSGQRTRASRSQSLSPTSSPVHRCMDDKEQDIASYKQPYSSVIKENKISSNETSHDDLCVTVPSSDVPTSSPEMLSPEIDSSSAIDSLKTYTTERRASKPESKAVKSVRRMSAAPPPPPPTHAASVKRLSTGDINLTAEASGRALTTSPPASIITTTLPFPVSKSSNPKFKLGQSSSTDEMMPSRREKKSRKPRSQTLSEGIKVDIEVLHSSFRRQQSAPASGSDLRSSKFLQRALPSPPPLVKEEETATPAAEEAGEQEHDEVENIYEMVSLVKETVALECGKHRSSPYEDIDQGRIYDDIDKPKRKRPPLKPPVSSGSLGPSSYYLEPVSHSSEPEKGQSGQPDTDVAPCFKKGDTKPKPGPRQKIVPLESSSSTSEPYVMMYANREMILDRPALNMMEGFRKMTAVNLSSLQTISESILVGIVPVGLTCDDSPKWKDFDVADGKPMYSHSGVAYYGAKSSMHNLDHCVLMISVFPVAWDVSEYSHINVVSPIAVFQDQVASEFFPDVSGLPDPHEYQLCGLVDTTVLLLNFQTVCNLEEYMNSLRLKWAQEINHYERQVCYILMQILNGLLYLTDKGCPVNSLHMQDILVVTPCGREEQIVVLNPHGHHMAGQKPLIKDLKKQVSKLLCLFLSVKIPLDDKSLYKVLFPIRSPFTKGLQKCHKAIHSDDPNAFILARNILEYLLWGPDEEEIKPLSLAEDRGQAFSMWLELQRCKIVSQHALKELSCNIETACRMNFLCAATGSTLFDTTKILHM